MTPIAFLPPAEEEMVAAARYYEAQSPGLGDRFLNEIQRSLETLSQNPLTAPEIKGDIRRRLLTKFPFGMVFVVEEDAILILAVMHLKRRPGYWEERLKK